jgi:hypothetical protein
MSLEQFWAFIVDYGGTGLVIVIVVAGIVGLHKSWPMLTKFIQVGNEVAELPETIKHLRADISDLSVKVVTIQKEVLPNGGSSLRDAVNRTEARLESITGTVEEHSKKLGE